MNGKAQLFVVLGLACLGQPVRAEAPPSAPDGPVIYDDGNRLHRNCSAQGPFAKGVCSGYILGVIDALSAVQNAVPENRTICLPYNPPLPKGALVDMVINYLTAHPESRSQVAPLLIHNALAATYPCSRAKREGSEPPKQPER